MLVRRRYDDRRSVWKQAREDPAMRTDPNEQNSISFSVTWYFYPDSKYPAVFSSGERTEGYPSTPATHKHRTRSKFGGFVSSICQDGTDESELHLQPNNGSPRRWDMPRRTRCQNDESSRTVPSRRCATRDSVIVASRLVSWSAHALLLCSEWDLVTDFGCFSRRRCHRDCS